MILFESDPRQRSRRRICNRAFSIAISVLIVIVVLAIPRATNAQDFNIELVAQVGGKCRGMHMEGNRVYLCEGAKLSILDVSDPTRPVRLGQVPVPKLLYGVHVSGNLAAAQGRLTGVYLFDVSDPRTPIVLSYRDASVNDFSPACHIAGNLLLASWEDRNLGTEGIYVFDITNPRAPDMRSSIDVRGVIDGAGPLVYVLGGGGLRVYDLSNPSAPVLRGTVPLSGTGSMDVQNDLAYVTDSDGLHIINVSNPAAPAIVGLFPFSPPPPTVGFGGVRVSGTIAYVTWAGSSVYLIDVSNPVLPQQRTIYEAALRNDNTLYLSSSGALFIHDVYDGFDVVDASNPVAPVRVGAYHSGAAEPMAVSVSDDIACVANYKAGLRVIDVSYPRWPTHLAGYEIAWNEVMAGPLRIHGNLAYVRDMIIDISNPAMPILSGSAPWHLLEVSGNLGFFAEGGVSIYDISNPLAPRPLGSYDVSARAIDVVQDMAYVVVPGSGGVTILDISNPSAPRSVGSYNPGGRVWDVLVHGNLAYLATYRGLEILDVSTPSQIRRLSVATTPGDAVSRIGLLGDLAYVPVGRAGDELHGLQVFDVSNPSAPGLVGSFALPEPFGYNRPRDAAYDPDGNAYIAFQDYGLWILRYTGPVLGARPSWQLYK